MLYLYAITEHPASLPQVPGIGDTALAAQRVETIDAVTGELDGQVESSEATILAHARVVEGLAALNAAVLPARFGRGYPDPPALERAIGERKDALLEGLERVSGCLELGLRVLAEPATHRAADGGGREYMLRRLDERRRAERLADELHLPLASLAKAETRSVAATPQLVLTASYLVDRGAVDDFRSAVDELGKSHPDLTLACTGPWPPYSFATAEMSAG